MVLKLYLLSNMAIFGIHVRFRGCRPFPVIVTTRNALIFHHYLGWCIKWSLKQSVWTQIDTVIHDKKISEFHILIIPSGGIIWTKWMFKSNWEAFLLNIQGNTMKNKHLCSSNAWWTFVFVLLVDKVSCPTCQGLWGVSWSSKSFRKSTDDDAGGFIKKPL